MRTSKLTYLSAVAMAAGFLSVASSGRAQDFGKNVTPDKDVSKDIGTGRFAALPFHVSATVREGYDDNVLTSAFNRQGSWFTSAAVDFSYTFGNPRTQLNLNSSLGTTYYYDRPGQEYDPNFSLGFTITHKATPRLTLAANTYATYQVQPNFSVNAGSNRVAGNYFYTADKFSVAYQWSPKFSTVTSYTLGLLHYDSSSIGVTENRFEHTLGNEFRYLVLPTTTLVGEYRFGIVDYMDSPRDSTSNFLLAGVDHSFNPRLNLSIRSGVEFRDTDNFGNRTEPYAETTLTYAVGRRTSVSWTNRYGLEQPDVASPSRTTFRTGLQGRYSIAPRVSTTLGFFYQHDDNQGVGVVQPAFTEDSFSLALGASYSITRNISVEAGYDWSEVYSDIVLREYSRNRYYLGVTAAF